jgi:hypothetical protein
MVDLPTPISSQTSYFSCTPPTNLAASKASSTSTYCPRTRAERAAEPHSAAKPNWALAPSQHSTFTKEPRAMYSNPPPPIYTPRPHFPAGLNFVTHGLISPADWVPVSLEEPVAAAPPHEPTETPLYIQPASASASAPSVHPSRLGLLQSSGALSGPESGPAETKEKITESSLKQKITGANTVRVAGMRKWGTGATKDPAAEISAPGHVDEKGSMDSRLPWTDRDPSAKVGAVPASSKTGAPVRISAQVATLSTSTKLKTCSVTVKSEDEEEADRPAPSTAPPTSHINDSSTQNTNNGTRYNLTPALSAPSLVRPSALKKRTVPEHQYEQANPFMNSEPAYESITTARPRPSLLQRMGMSSRIGPSALAARRELFIGEDGRTYDHVYQGADEEEYEEYEGEEYWTPPSRPAGWKKVIIAEPVGREERAEHTPPIRAPAKRMVRIAEPTSPPQVQTSRRRMVHYQEAEEGEEGGYGTTYEQFPEEDLHFRTATSRRFPVSQAEHNPPPRAFTTAQQDSPRHVAGSRTRRVVIQAPLEVDDVDEVAERFRGLSVAGRVQTPGPRRHRIVKVQ